MDNINEITKNIQDLSIEETEKVGLFLSKNSSDCTDLYSIFKDIFIREADKLDQIYIIIQTTEENTILSCLIYKIDFQLNDAYIYILCVNSKFSGQGYGSKALINFENSMKKQNIITIRFKISKINSPMNKIALNLSYSDCKYINHETLIFYKKYFQF